MKMKTKFEVRLLGSEWQGSHYVGNEVLSKHASVDVAQRARLKAEKKFPDRVTLVAVTPWGDATVWPDELWKWGSKEQRVPFHAR